jgi:hypothetical protein
VTEKHHPIDPTGSGLYFASGVVGISLDLTAYDLDSSVCVAGDLDEAERLALADFMIALWTRFRQGDPV